MKIKEVMEQTGLTDRAIRLYISNGLVTPENQKNYTGRNNYNFTEDDVTMLKRIALLRKADFSIEQIKLLMQENTEARNMLISFVAEKHKLLERDQKILNALDEVVSEGLLSISKLCEKLENSLYSKPVPEVDLGKSKKERYEQFMFLLLSGLLGFGAILIFIYFAIMDFKEFPFPKFYTKIENYIGVITSLIPIVLMLVVFLSHIKSRFLEKKQKAISTTLIVVTVLLLLSPLDLFFRIASPIYSETDDPSNYLQFGDCAKRMHVLRNGFFPAAIPRSAISWESQWYPPNKFPETTKYYYKHEHDFDPYFDIYAEWKLTEAEYRAEISRIRTLYQDDPKAEFQWGDWICLSFTEYPLEDAATLDHYDYTIFAYNDKTFAVRYIVSYSVDWGDSIDPYFLSLEW